MIAVALLRTPAPLTDRLVRVHVLSEAASASLPIGGAVRAKR